VITLKNSVNDSKKFDRKIHVISNLDKYGPSSNKQDVYTKQEESSNQV
jgi:hypothetical protein